MVSMIVGIELLHMAMGAGCCALTSLPGGRITFSGRNSPSVTMPCGATMHLKATRAAATPPEGPGFNGPRVCSGRPEKSIVISSPATMIFTFTGNGPVTSR